jgi:hypothetical protein
MSNRDFLKELDGEVAAVLDPGFKVEVVDTEGERL